MNELRACRYCHGKAKRYTREGRNYIGKECFVSTCYCMMCGMQVEAFDESPMIAEDKAADWWNRGIYDVKH